MFLTCTADWFKKAGQIGFTVLRVSLLAQLVLVAYFQSVYARAARVSLNKTMGEQTGRQSTEPGRLLTALCFGFLVQFADHLPAQARILRFSPAESSQQQQNLAALNTQEVVTLEVGKPVERELRGGGEHSYSIALVEGQYTSIIVEQRGIDVIVRLLNSKGGLISEFDSDVIPSGEERASFVAEVGGNYSFNVKARYKRSAAGRYEIRVTELRTATENDDMLQKARKLSAEAIQLSDDGKDDEAITKSEQSLRIRQQILGEDHLEVADSLKDLATRYLHAEGEIKGEELLRGALSIREKVLGADHPLTASLLFDLATIHINKREFVQARKLLQRVLAALEIKLGREHPWVADALVKIAATHSRNGDGLAAEPLLERALEIDKSRLGYEDAITYNTLRDLLSSYEKRQDYEKGEALSRRALDQLEKEFGAQSPNLIYYLINLGGTYSLWGNYVKAGLTFQHALQISEKANLMDHGITAVTIQRLARIYELQGDSAKAGQLLERALSIWQNLLGKDHPNVIGNLSNLVKFYAVAGKIEQVIAFQVRENEITERMISRNLFESERQKLSYLSARSEQGDRSISLHLHLAPQNVAARDLAVNYILQRKGRVQDAVADNLAALRRRFGKEDRMLLDKLNDTTNQLAKLVLGGPKNMTPSEHQQQVDVFEKERERLEAEISRRSDGFYQKSNPVTVADVKSAIPKSAALIEFVLYRPFDPKANKENYDDPHYAAYVIRGEGEVQGRELGAAKEIDDAIDAWRRALRDPMRRDVQQLARTVDEKLTRPIRSLVADATHLMISPDGQLNLIPFQALVDEHGQSLVQRYLFTYLTSGRELLRMQVVRQSNNLPLVVADPRFGDPPLIAGSKADDGSSRPRIDYSQIFFGPLPGVKDEIRVLKTLLPNASFLTGDQATKDALKRVAAPRILHIATHGFFLPDKASLKTDKTKPSPTNGARVGKFALYTDNPLLRSGLALAGANVPSETDDNGILTALEASGLNLWGTKLVVLSACDTGSGEVHNGEGVYGLRRAFVLAGAETQLMSLWQISDRSTRDLMIGYYNGLVLGQGRSDALRQVQLQMIRSKVHRHPYYWASFILAGDWANLKGRR